MYAFTLTKIASNRAVLYGGYPVDDGQSSQKVYVLEYAEKELVGGVVMTLSLLLSVLMHTRGYFHSSIFCGEIFVRQFWGMFLCHFLFNMEP